MEEGQHQLAEWVEGERQKKARQHQKKEYLKRLKQWWLHFERLWEMSLYRQDLD